MRVLKRLALAVVVSLLLAPRMAAAVDGDRFGEVTVTRPTGPMRGVVMLISDRDGWTPADAAAAQQLGQAGVLVMGIDLRFYRYRLAEVDEACHVLIGDVEALSRSIQRDAGSGAYRFPILAGIGEGGAVAEAILAQARVNTVAGAVSVDPPAEPMAGRPPCTDVTAMTVAPDAATRSPGPLSGFWSVGLKPSTPPAERARLAAWAAAGTTIDQQELAPTLSDADALVAMIKPHLEPVATGSTTDDLPLIVLPAEHPSGVMAVVVSGDGGWRDIDKTVADHLQSNGVSVVGWDALRYFWHKKTPDEFARDLASVLQTYTAQWHPKRVILIGYSFGADALPFGFNRLPSALRSNVAMITLLGFAKEADFEISVTGWLGAAPSSQALAVGPEIDRIPAGLIQCFYGKDETDSDCPSLSPHSVEVIEMPGSHHFDGDYASVVQRILAGLTHRGS